MPVSTEPPGFSDTFASEADSDYARAKRRLGFGTGPLEPWAILQQREPEAARAELAHAVDLVYNSGLWGSAGGPAFHVPLFGPAPCEADPAWVIAFAEEVISRFEHPAADVDAKIDVQEAARQAARGLQALGCGDLVPKPSLLKTFAFAIGFNVADFSQDEALHLIDSFNRVYEASEERTRSHGPGTGPQAFSTWDSGPWHGK